MVTIHEEITSTIKLKVLNYMSAMILPKILFITIHFDKIKIRIHI